MKYFQCLTEVTATRQKNEEEGRTERLVELSLWEEEVPGCSCEGRQRGLSVSCSCCSALASRLWQPGLAQEVIFRVTWRMRVGWSEEKWGGGSRSQGGLQGRVQDVIIVAVAVGVAVIALGAGVVGGLLQPHQHVHQWVSFRVAGGHLLAC